MPGCRQNADGARWFLLLLALFGCSLARAAPLSDPPRDGHELSSWTFDLGVWHAGLPGPTLALLEWKRREYGVSTELARTLPVFRSAPTPALDGLYADLGLGARWQMAYEAGEWWSMEEPYSWRIGYTSLNLTPRAHLMTKLQFIGDRWAAGWGYVLTTGFELGFASAKDDFWCEDNSTERYAAMLEAEQAEQDGEEPPEIPELEVTCHQAFHDRNIDGPHWTGFRLHPTLRLSRPPGWVDDVRFRPDTISLGLRQVPFIGRWYTIQITWHLSKPSR